MSYQRADTEFSVRIVWPLGLFYWGEKWTLGAWCELRGAFRSFRLDRIADLHLAGARFTAADGRTLGDLLTALGADEES
jgi:predicted DNA-binding transcriptional regulator YafY